ncbi:hypothetical protein BBW68_10135 [Candidatus Erwinia dacicola]|uniref:Uncharacterized protein n=1 Tax=Candidatus Erwinia dacicola TaxID=252393 RepID=A0A1E7Z0M9_9GAMM|nr:hypothetical protein BBW68_10135 [Candidatus Erwinia dacicola]
MFLAEHHLLFLAVAGFVGTGTPVTLLSLLPQAFFDLASGTDKDTGSCCRRFLSKTFISLSHVKIDLSDVKRHNLSMERRNMTLRLQTGQSNCRNLGCVP